MSHPAIADHLVYVPVQEYEGERRIYFEMHTKDWLWKIQVSADL